MEEGCGLDQPVDTSAKRTGRLAPPEGTVVNVKDFLFFLSCIGGSRTWLNHQVPRFLVPLDIPGCLTVTVQQYVQCGQARPGSVGIVLKILCIRTEDVLVLVLSLYTVVGLL